MNAHRKEHAACRRRRKGAGQRRAFRWRVSIASGGVLALVVGSVAACHGRPMGTSTPVPGPASVTAAVVPPRRPGIFPTDWSLGRGRSATSAPHAMVASNSGLASAAGVETLRRGGNAVDAAVAVGFALAVTYPEAGNIGGGGFMVIRMADGRAAAFDYREVAPLAATRDMFEHGLPDNASVIGPKAVAVPGSVAGMAAALRAFGRLPLKDVIAPAIRLAREGFTVDSAFAASVAEERERIASFAGAAVFLPGGAPPAVGSRFVQPALARTLQLIADQGPAAFYRGPVAHAIVDEMRPAGGLMTEADLEQYQPVQRAPLIGAYRGYTLLTMPPPTSGGVTMIETLNILETFDSLPAFGSAKYAHLLAGAFQRAFVDRNATLGDPSFVAVPVARLTDKGYARRIHDVVAAAHATPTSRLAPALVEGSETTHYSVVDGEGDAVATTTTLDDSYGSGVYVRDGGFFLNDEMDDFATRPGVPNMFGIVEGGQNAIVAGKRMLSSMSPTIVLDPAGHLFLVVGGRGGPRIVTSTTQVILNMIDHRMGIVDALAAPRLHHQALPDSLRYEPNGLTAPVRDSLSAMGHQLAVRRASGSCTAVARVADGYEGAVDPRAPGGAIGY